MTEREQTIIDACFRHVWEARQFLKAAPGTVIGYAAARAIYAMGWQAALPPKGCGTCPTCGHSRLSGKCLDPFHTEPL